MPRLLLPLVALAMTVPIHLPALSAAQPAQPVAALARMPVKEVTVFKDGHAYVLHQGVMPTDAAGNVVLNQLPTPVLGTFWPYSLDAKAALKSVVAARKRVKVPRTALTMRDLIDANIGAEVVVTDVDKNTYEGSIVQVLNRSAEELEATSAVPVEAAPIKGTILLLKTKEGTRALPAERVRDFKFTGAYETKIADEEYRNLLTMQLDWKGQPAAKSAEVGMAYVQKGIRWIPNYRVELKADGKASVKLQATILNELADLSDATVNLVVGVPSFYFKETADPIALSQAVAQLSPYFQTDANSTQYALSNAMMTQVARGGEVRQGRQPKGGGPGGAANAEPVDLGPEVGGVQERNEDLFVYTLKNVTLAKGHRMVVPVSEATVDTRDVYTLDIPYGPPVEFRNSGNAQAQELLKLMEAPKVTHKVRLSNGAAAPLTTAPALILRDGKVLAQAMMTYTPRGGQVDLTLTAAVNVQVKKTDKETKRTPNAVNFNGDNYYRVDLAGTLDLTNHGPKPIEVEVTRYVLGHIESAGEGAKAEMVNQLEEDVPGGRPAWWGYYSWPAWWAYHNGVGKMTWTAKLAPKQTASQSYAWYYYWR